MRIQEGAFLLMICYELDAWVDLCREKMLMKGFWSYSSTLLGCHSIKQIGGNVIATRFYVLTDKFVNLFRK